MENVRAYNAIRARRIAVGAERKKGVETWLTEREGGELFSPREGRKRIERRKRVYRDQSYLRG